MNPSRNPDYIGRIRLEFTVGFASLLILAGGLATFMFAEAESERTRNVYAFGTAVSTAVASGASAFYLLQSIRHGTSVNQSNNQIDRTIDYIARWNGPHYTTAKRIALECHDLIEGKSPSEQEKVLTEYFDEKPSRRQEMADIFNFLEELSLAIKHDLIDPVLCREFFRGIVVNYCKTFDIFIIRRRKKNGNTDRLYRNLTDLAESWNDRNAQS